MRRNLVGAACLVTIFAVGAPLLARPGMAGSSITGTVRATGLSSSADAVVYLQQVEGAFPPSAATMDQKTMQFVPHVLAVVAGSTVKFVNSDPTPHNVFSPDNEKYNLGTWPQGQSKDYTFSKCTKFPCVYTQLCRVHPEMEGFIIVLQNPYFAVSDRDGKFEIKDVPPGTYTVGVWHSKLKGQPKSVVVMAGKPATVEFTLAR
jgi:plastocyanin